MDQPDLLFSMLFGEVPRGTRDYLVLPGGESVQRGRAVLGWCLLSGDVCRELSVATSDLVEKSEAPRGLGNGAARLQPAHRPRETWFREPKGPPPPPPPRPREGPLGLGYCRLAQTSGPPLPQRVGTPRPQGLCGLFDGEGRGLTAPRPPPPPQGPWAPGYAAGACARQAYGKSTMRGPRETGRTCCDVVMVVTSYANLSLHCALHVKLISLCYRDDMHLRKPALRLPAVH